MLGGVVPGGETSEMRMFVVPRADYRIIDNWHAMGLRGTGSKDVEANDIFVPEHRTLGVEATRGGRITRAPRRTPRHYSGFRSSRRYPTC